MLEVDSLVFSVGFTGAILFYLHQVIKNSQFKNSNRKEERHLQKRLGMQLPKLPTNVG